jgi:hypothetical protein
VTITDSYFGVNSAKNHGGGIINMYYGTLTVSDSTFHFNNATTGGGIWNNGMLDITNSRITSNEAVDGSGISNDVDGTLTITNSTFATNKADEYGGGIYNSGTLAVTNSRISLNKALWGGGIFNDLTLDITDSTFSSNGADFGGGIYNHENSTLTITNSTFFNNTANFYGGGISNWQGTVTINNSTFSTNSADHGGNIDNSGTLEITNSILADSPSGGNCEGTITDGGHNIDDGDTCSFGPDSWINTDPLLAPLEDNGGPTRTHALLEGSPAIDNADPLYCPAADQRGFPRPFDGDGDGEAICDVGAFEFQPRRLFLPIIIR